MIINANETNKQHQATKQVNEDERKFYYVGRILISFFSVYGTRCDRKNDVSIARWVEID